MVIPYWDFKKGKNVQMTEKKKLKKVTLSLDVDTMNLLNEVANTCGYGSISASVRILVKKYGTKEIKDTR